MSIISIFNGRYCDAQPVIRHLTETSDFSIITDQDLIAAASESSGIHPEKIKQAFSCKTSVFNQFTFEKERSIAYLKQSTAERIQDGDVIIHGFCSLLVPGSISHMLRICIAASRKHRLIHALQEHPVNEKEADRDLIIDEQNRSEWTRMLFSNPDPWDSSLYDMVIPIEDEQPAHAASMIQQHLQSETLLPTAESCRAAADFLLSARVQSHLIDAGHNVGVTASDTNVLLTINRQVLMLERLEEELKKIAGMVEGTGEIEVRLHPDCADPPPYRKHNHALPSKVLLVDDEREFVQTLSERLQMREMGAVVAYDGPSALDLVHSDDPEVMIIDLKMPGMDGMEVLRQVKTFRPGIEVIVLTGHGSEVEEKDAMSLGAFAYLHKPVDINELSSLLKQAHEKIKTAG